eukprot:gnl/MRDRNA2_/MRDRNA2_82078_c0_seq1.p1 gnl/MRDRNA2_/MRDRNA2_82078_c0~~gnl/MRDRNA2_/MRDRNA2_82078_c0_seq1.p1  ORF type:complete len:449 (+),score=62.90 gnl/MRDRNA2_/MRDRNA2_82078_c0_seq1:126-1349(+)
MCDEPVCQDANGVQDVDFARGFPYYQYPPNQTSGNSIMKVNYRSDCFQEWTFEEHEQINPGVLAIAKDRPSSPVCNRKASNSSIPCDNKRNSSRLSFSLSGIFSKRKNFSGEKKEEEEEEQQQEGEEQLQKRISNARRSQKEKDARRVSQQLSNMPCTTEWCNTCENTDTAATNALMSRIAKINACKARLNEKMQVIKEVANDSPLLQIPADYAVRFWSSRLGTQGCVDLRTFLLHMKGMVLASDQHLVNIFNSIDIDGTGFIDRSMWISFLPLFFGHSAESLETTKAVFAEIDQDKNGLVDQQEFITYVSATVSLLVPPAERELRDRLQRHLAKEVFAEIDRDGDNTLCAEEYCEWAQLHCLQSRAMHYLEVLVPEDKERPRSRKSSLSRVSKRFSRLMAGVKASL